MGKKIVGVLKRLYNALGMFGGFMLAVSTFLAALNAILRYGFKAGMPWSEEVCTYLCILLTFLAISWLETEDRHLSIDIFNTTVKSEVVKKIIYIVRGIITLGIFAILIKSGFGTIKSTFQTQAVTYVLQIPRYILYTIVVGSYALFIIGWLAILFCNRGSKFE